MQIHQFYFISDVDDDAVTLFAVQVNPVISFEICYDARRHSSPYCCWSLWWISADGTFSATRNLITMCCSTLRGTFCSLITLATPRQDWTGSNPSRSEGGGCGFTLSKSHSCCAVRLVYTQISPGHIWTTLYIWHQSLFIFRWLGWLIGLWCRAGPRHVAAPGRLIICCSLKPKFFKFFRPRTGLVYILKERVQNVDYFQSSSFECGIPSFLAPYFRLFQWRLRAPYVLEPRPAPWLARPLFHPSFHMKPTRRLSGVKCVFVLRESFL